MAAPRRRLSLNVQACFASFRFSILRESSEALKEASVCGAILMRCWGDWFEQWVGVVKEKGMGMEGSC